MHLTRREWMAALAAAGSASAAPPAGPGRPDVLFILTDQWNPRCLGYAGDTAVGLTERLYQQYRRKQKLGEK